MALPNISFVKEDGNIRSNIETNDGVSLIIFYDANLTSNDYSFFELKDAENAGFTYNSGTNGIKSIINYHISEYFKYSSNKLYIKTLGAADSFACIESMVIKANAEGTPIKLISVYDNITALDLSKVTACSTAISNLGTIKMPTSGVSYTAKVNGSVNTLTALTTITANNIGVCVSQDLTTDSIGKELWDYQNGTAGKLVGAVGTITGLISSNTVAESSAVPRFDNVNLDGQFSSLGFVTGETYISFTNTAITAMHDKHYQFFLKIPGRSGSFLNFDFTATSTSDYQYVSRNRVYAKVFDKVYASLILDLNKKLKTVAGGDIDALEKQLIKTQIETQLKQMIQNDEISDYEVIIPPQDVATTNEVKITLKVRPYSYMSYVTISFNYTV